MLDEDVFKIVVDSTPIISIDILVKKDNKILLGKRVNKPAKGYFFSIGGRVRKNEAINQAMKRIANNELSIRLKSIPKFIGVFEHFYDLSIYKNVSTHYINLAYEYEINDFYDFKDFPKEQHNEYKWFTLNELLEDKKVHKYVKEYFRKSI